MLVYCFVILKMNNVGNTFTESMNDEDVKSINIPTTMQQQVFFIKFKNIKILDMLP